MRVISFSLWGAEPKYVTGALRNAALAPSVYPGWRCRFYAGQTVPEADLETLAAWPHVDIIRLPEPGNWTSTFWRFHAAADPGVEVAIFRDTDSRLDDRERAAVDAWLAGDRDVHVMRDHPLHDVPILAGMWGVRRRALPDLDRWIAQYAKSDYWQIDQDFLAEIVAPRVRDRWIEHDEYHARRPFPTRRRGRRFVGQPFDEHDRALSKVPPISNGVCASRRGPSVRSSEP